MKEYTWHGDRAAFTRYRVNGWHPSLATFNWKEGSRVDLDVMVKIKNSKYPTKDCLSSS
jgi:hypothetical protein